MSAIAIAELISYAVWLYFRFPLSLSMVEEMLAARGILATICSASSLAATCPIPTMPASAPCARP